MSKGTAHCGRSLQQKYTLFSLNGVPNSQINEMQSPQTGLGWCRLYDRELADLVSSDALLCNEKLVLAQRQSRGKSTEIVQFLLENTHLSTVMFI